MQWLKAIFLSYLQYISKFFWKKSLLRLGFLSFIFYLLSFSLQSQDQIIIAGYATLQKIEDLEGTPDRGIRIMVYNDNGVFLTQNATNSGSFLFKLPIGADYFVEWSKPGYTTKRILFDLNDVVPGSIKKKSSEFQLDVALVETTFLTDDLKEEGAINRVYWSERKSRLTYEANKSDDYWQRLDELAYAYDQALKDIESERMSDVIFRMENEIVWPEDPGDDFTIMIVDDYNTFVQMKLAQKSNPKYAKANIRFIEGGMDALKKPENSKYDLLFVNAESGIESKELMEAVPPTTLLITEGYGFLQSMIDITNGIYDTKFEVNNIELVKRGFATTEAFKQMEEFIEDESQYADVMDDAQSSIKSEKDKAKNLEEEKLTLEQINLQLERARAAQDSALRVKALEMALLEQDIIAKAKNLEAMNARINKQNQSLVKAQKEFEQKQLDLENTVAALNAKEAEMQKFDEMLAKTTAEIEKQRANLAQTLQLFEDQRKFTYAMAGVAVLISFLLIIAFRNYRKQRRYAIENQKQATRIEAQREQLKEKNTELNDSINYAKRIQDAMLPKSAVMDDLVEDMFILYQPKDIVAGDFYWIQRTGDIVYFAVADCTGHGVPGAMMSVVCHNAMNRAFRELGATTPAKILDTTRDYVIEQVASTKDVKDGMDISLCSWNSKTKVLQFAGAHNPLWVVTDRFIAPNDDDMALIEVNERKILEVKADKQPVGRYENAKPFKNHEVQLVSGDTIYIFSDGFSDQFGGTKGKKLKQSLFKELLALSGDKTCAEQHEFLTEYFLNWRGEIEQIDDVCVMGVKI